MNPRGSRRELFRETGLNKKSGGATNRPKLSPLAVVASALRRDWKRLAELHYWKFRRRREGPLKNDHYGFFYTSHFGLGERDYSGKVVLDLGCGPRGSLEWATMSARRIGLDPLANEYRKLGADRHSMEYVAAPSESIPLPTASCDIVSAFNSLDHVDDVERTIAEIKRVTRPGGFLLLIVEVNHPPTVTEPHLLTVRRLSDLLAPQFSCEQRHVYRPVATGAYDSIRCGIEFDDAMNVTEAGWLSARFRRAGE